MLLTKRQAASKGIEAKKQQLVLQQSQRDVVRAH
jgi:hypothetical protein